MENAGGGAEELVPEGGLETTADAELITGGGAEAANGTLVESSKTTAQER